MAEAIISLSSRRLTNSRRNRFAKRHYEAIATAIQEARRRIEYGKAGAFGWLHAVRHAASINVCGEISRVTVVADELLLVIWAVGRTENLDIAGHSMNVRF